MIVHPVTRDSPRRRARRRRRRSRARSPPRHGRPRRRCGSGGDGARRRARGARPERAPRREFDERPRRLGAFARASHARGCPGRARAGPRARARSRWLLLTGVLVGALVSNAAHATSASGAFVLGSASASETDSPEETFPGAFANRAPFALTDETDPTRASGGLDLRLVRESLRSSLVWHSP